MFELLNDLLFGAPAGLHDYVMAFGPLALAGIGMAASALGGLISSKANKKTRVNIDIPPELQQQIDALGNQNYFMPLLQRLASNNTQGNYNIAAMLARKGIDSPAMALELMQQGQRQQQQAVGNSLGNLEGLRLNALSQALGMMSGIKTKEGLANAQYQQAYNDNRLGILDSAIGGIGGSLTQGIGGFMQQQSLDKILNMSPQMQTGQVGGMGFNLLDQFGTGSTGMSGFGGDNFGMMG